MRGLLAAALLGIAMLTCPAAEAQDGAADRARAAFDEAIGLAERGEWTIAIQRFEQALALRDAPAIRFNLAQSLSHVGRLVEAVDNLDQLEASAEATPALRRSAQELRAEIAPRIGRVIVRVRGDAAGLAVQFPPHAAQPVVGETSAPADPGPLQVQLLRDGEVVDELSVSVPEGGVTHVVLTYLGREGAFPGEAHADPAAQPGESSGEDVASSWWLWTIITVVVLGAAGGVIGGVFAADASQPTPREGDFDPPVISLSLGGAF